MYQFTTTTIINSNLDSNGTTAKFAGTANAFSVSRVGKFLPANVVSVYKRAYYADVLEVAKVQIPAITTGLVARLDVDVRLSQQTDSEYANTYLYFKKPVTVEVISTGVAATTADALVAQLNGLRDRFGFAYVKAEVIDTDYIQFTATNPNQRFFSAKILKEDASPNSMIEQAYEDVSSTTFSVTTAGVVGFGNDDWMQRKIMVQTMENTRYFGMNKEERPVIGGNYNQYTLRYKVLKDTEDGISNGVNYSVTTHVFYVKSDLVTAFELALTNTNLSTDTIGKTVTAVAIATASVNTAASTPGVQLVITTTPSGVTGAVYSLRPAGNVDANSSGADFTKVSVSSSGVLKFASAHGIVATDTIGLTVVVDGVTFATTVVMTT